MMEFQTGAKTVLVSATALIVGSQGAEAQNWDGGYVGLSVSGTSGDAPWNVSGGYDDYTFDGDAVLGAFVGYNFTTTGGLQLGMEFAYQGNTGVTGEAFGGTSDPYMMDQIVDAKFRVGTSFGSNMNAYGFGGISAGTMSYYDTDNNYAAWGLNFGFGVEAIVGENYVIGVEYIARHMRGYNEGMSQNDLSHSIALRAAFRF